MFRQVVAVRWKDGVSPEAKQGYRDALDSLRGIPQLLTLTWGDDARHFDGNFDFVAVMDFADFASARTYVEHPLHEAYVRDHASLVVGERVVVQHDWTPRRRDALTTSDLHSSTSHWSPAVRDDVGALVLVLAVVGPKGAPTAVGRPASQGRVTIASRTRARQRRWAVGLVRSRGRSRVVAADADGSWERVAGQVGGVVRNAVNRCAASEIRSSGLDWNSTYVLE